MTNSSRKCVAIIGAGVSGLVSAVNMYRVGIQPIVFDKASNIGGMWNIDIKPCWNSMRTNISKFSTALSDFAWPKDAPLFPSQREVYLYLCNYIQQSLPGNIFRFNTQVTNITYSNDKWTLQYSTKLNHISSEQFDFIIIASGFFDHPHIPENITDLSSFQGTLMHSCEYRSPEQVRDKRVIIIGASMSAAEIAADMSTSAKHIIHIVPHSFWSMPRFIPLKPNDPVSPFLPIDFVFYRRSQRTSNHEILFRTGDEYKKLNGYLRLITNNSQQSSSLIDANDENPPFIAISDMYAEWNRAGKIILKQGRLVKVEKDGT
jgi:cation diffusion facilitator CzcD-associated flavoprotein CzcO